MPLVALVVDDEPLAREGLRMLLAPDPEIGEVHEAKDGREAVDAIRRVRPDLVFLDVQMPEMDGCSVVEAIGADRMPAVVFVTAHDRYAIQAFEVNALDYLLKPVTAGRFAQALARVKARIRAGQAEETSGQILGLLEALASPRRYLRRVAVRTAGKTQFVDLEQVDFIKAAENYVELCSGRTRHLLHAAMNTLERSLDPERFARIHRGTIVNIERIKELEPSAHGEYRVTLHDGTRLVSGRTYAKRLKELASNPF